MRKIIQCKAIITICIVAMIVLSACDNNEPAQIILQGDIVNEQSEPEETMEADPPTEVETDERETEPNPEEVAPQVPAPQAPVDLWSLLYSNLDEVRHLLGNEIRSATDGVWDGRYSFDSGLLLGIENNTIESISINYGQTGNRTAYYFNGIDGTSSYDDVIALLGDEPDNTREEPIEEWGESVNSYGYFIEEHSFVWVSFNANGNVVGISLFLAGF
jgi:hypothetical protein